MSDWFGHLRLKNKTLRHMRDSGAFDDVVKWVEDNEADVLAKIGEDILALEREMDSDPLNHDPWVHTCFTRIMELYERRAEKN